MLQNLHVKNLALIDEVEITFHEHLNILTGETGAGKSILLNSIRMIIGERISRDLIRSGCEKAVVTATFCNLSDGVVHCLKELGLEVEDGELILRREISIDGKNQIRFNGVPLPLAMLRQIGGLLVDIHGQHDSRSLLDSALHVDYLDHYAGIEVLRQEYNTVFTALRRVQREMEQLRTDEAEKQYRMEYLQFTADEISAAGLSEAEEEQLRRRRTVLVNFERIARSIGSCRESLSGDNGARDRIAVALEAVKAVESFSPELESLCSRLTDLSDSLEDLIRELGGQIEEDTFDPEELEQIEARLDLFYRLKQKYGGSVRAVLERGKAAQEELNTILCSDQRLIELSARQTALEEQLDNCSGRLTEARREAACRLEKEIEAQMHFLDMPGAVFQVSITPCVPGATGADQVVFLLSANVGEEVRPLAKIASGGELSRIMLSLKAVLISENEAQTLVFDEIDTGVSGKAAEKIALKLRELSRRGQVLVVTHLAQIAAYAKQHFRIEKQERDGRTFTAVYPLDHSGRREELARIMGGLTPGQATYKAAEEFLLSADKK